MKFFLHECVIAWNAGTDHVELVSKETGSTILPRYRYFWGLSETEYGKLTDADRKKLVLTQALNLIVTYHCDPQAVHQVLLQLYEYVECWVDLFTQHLDVAITQ